MHQSTTAKNASTRGGQFLRSFAAHPASVGETYLQHLCFALQFSGRLLGASMAALIHALIPALFETTASQLVQSMHADIAKRHSPVDPKN